MLTANPFDNGSSCYESDTASTSLEGYENADRKRSRKKALDLSLQAVANEGGSFDSTLMSMLLDCSASADYNDGNGNPLVIAVQKGDIAMLQILCGAKLSVETLENAVHMVSDALLIPRYGLAFESLKMLIRAGATCESLVKL
jgi:hypothetical protein